MKNIRVLFSPTEVSDFRAELNAFELKAGVSAAEIGRRISQEFDSNERTESNIYGFFKRQERTYPRDKVKSLAKILGVDVSVITKLNSMIEGEHSSESLELPGSFDVREALADFPAEMSSLSEFLLWIDFLKNKKKFLETG